MTAMRYEYFFRSADHLGPYSVTARTTNNADSETWQIVPRKFFEHMGSTDYIMVYRRPYYSDLSFSSGGDPTTSSPVIFRITQSSQLPQSISGRVVFRPKFSG